MRTLIILLVIITLAGCRSSKKVVERTSVTEKVDSVSTRKDSIRETTVNKAIDDEFGIKVAESNTNDKKLDSIVNSKVDQILSQVNTTKRSGDNSYRLYYDRQLRELKAQIELGETKNESVSTESETEKSSKETQTDSERIEKVLRGLPWWVYVILVVWFLPQLIDRIKMLNPVLGLIKRS